MSGKTKMDPTVKARWLEALRSGRYRQGLGALRPSSTRFCCLGVLCDILEPEGWRQSSNMDFKHLEFNFMPGQSTYGKAGMTGDEMGDMDTLSRMNDEGQSFEQIARWIEENL